MTTDKTPPAPCNAPCNDVPETCDAPVLGEAEIARIRKRRDAEMCVLLNAIVLYNSYRKVDTTIPAVSRAVLNTLLPPVKALLAVTPPVTDEIVDDMQTVLDSHAALTARLRAAEERERTASVVLRPEVQAFAEAIQCLLDKNQGDKGDGWKGDDLNDLYVSLDRAMIRLHHAIYRTPTPTARLVRVGEAAISVGAHAMFIADVAGALASPEVAALAAKGGTQ